MSKIGPLDKKRPLILVTNDDGITAPGIRCLIDVMNEIGEVVVIAPDSPQSAMGHAITINSTLHCQKVVMDTGPQEPDQRLSGSVYLRLCRSLKGDGERMARR